MQAAVVAASAAAAQQAAAANATSESAMSAAADLMAAAAASASFSEEDELKLLHFPSKREDLSTAIPLTVIFALLLVTGCVGNICTAIVIARPKNKYMHTATNYYLFSLAMSDFMFLILGLPQEMYTLWQRYPYAFGESFCVIRGYLSEASTYASILTISAFTVERYVAICHPLWAHTMSQLPRAITSIVIIWCLAALCAIPPAAELGIVTQQGPMTNRTLEQSAQCAQKRTIFENMFVMSAIVFFIVPMIIVTVLYILIALELRRSSRMNNAISKQTSSHLSTSTSQHQHLNNNNNNHHHHHHHHHHNHHNHHNHHRSHHNHLSHDPHPHHDHRHHCHCLMRQQQQQHNHQDSNYLTTGVSKSSSAASKSHQQLIALGSSDKQQQQQPRRDLSHATACLIDQDINNGRPSSAIGTERAPCTCCHLSSGPGKCDKRPRSALGSSLARLQQAALGGKLCNHLLGGGGGGGWSSGANSRPASAIGTQVACPEEEAGACREKQGGVSLAGATNKHESLSRQHSPLSYHESLMQKGLGTGVGAASNHNQQHHLKHHHSAIDMNSNQLCSRSFHASHQHRAHHQLSLTHLPANHRAGAGSLLNQHLKHQQQQQQVASSHHRRSNAASSKKSVIRMLVAVVVSFFICWVPFHAQRLLASYLVKDENQNQLLLDIYLKLTYISGVMYYLSSTINPLLYQLMSAKFRLAFKETFKCSLFKCAIFRRASTATVTTQAAVLVAAAAATPIGPDAAPSRGHSPTNSVRGHGCQCQAIVGAEANSTASTNHDNGPGVGVGVLLARKSDSSSDLHTNQHQACCHCCCCCGSSNYYCEQHPTALAAPASALGRLRGRLNASLTSLFKMSSQEQTTSDSCEDSCPCQQLASTPGGAKTTTTSANRKLAGQDKRRQMVLLAANSGAAHEERPPTNCPSAPLLAASPAARKSPAPPGGQLSHLQANFPAHHTMLKFIRSPSPGGATGGQANQAQSLTRLSSREDDDDDHDDHEEPDVLVADLHDEHRSAQKEDREQEQHQFLKVLDATKMSALIRPASSEQQKQDQETDESEAILLLVANNTPTGSGASTSEEGVARSSADSSPDQLAAVTTHTTMSTNPTTTTTTSSSSSLALLGGGGGGASNLGALGGRGHKQPLAQSKSANERARRPVEGVARPSDQKRAWQSQGGKQRRRSLQQTPGHSECDPSRGMFAARRDQQQATSVGRRQLEQGRAGTQQPVVRRQPSSSLSSSEICLDHNPSQFARNHTVGPATPADRRDSHDLERLSQSTTETSAPDSSSPVASLSHLSHPNLIASHHLDNNLTSRAIQITPLPFG